MIQFGPFLSRGSPVSILFFSEVKLLLMPGNGNFHDKKSMMK